MKLLSTHCPKCVILEKKLEQKQIKFDLIDNEDEVIRIANSFGMNTAPILILDSGEALEFSKAISLVNNME